MIWVALQWLGSALGSLLGLILRHPLPFALVASLAACAWLYSGREKARDQRDAHKAAHVQTIRNYREAQNYALEKAKARIAQLEEQSKEKARASDTRHTAALESARSATDRYIAAHRLRPEAACRAPGGAPAPGENPDPRISEALPAESIVVAADDVRKCGDAVTYAIQAHLWAKTLNEVDPN